MALLAVDEVMLREPRLLVPTTPPLGLVEVDVTHPVWRRLDPSFFAIAQRRTPYTIVPGRAEAFSFEPVQGGSIRQAMFSANGGTSDGWRTTKSADFLSNTTTLSGFIRFKSTAIAGNPTIFAWWGAGGTNGGYITLWDSSQITTIVADTNNSAFWCARRTASAGVGTWNYGFTWNGGNSMDVYLNGKPDNGTYWFQNNCTRITSTATPMHFCRHTGDATGSGSDQVECAVLSHGKIWTALDHAAIAADPYQFLVPAI